VYSLLKSFTHNTNEWITKVDAFSARRNIHYYQHGGETMLYSLNDDTDEEDVQENNEVKLLFSLSEDNLLW